MTSTNGHSAPGSLARMATWLPIEGETFDDAANGDEPIVVHREMAAACERMKRALYRESNGHVLVTGLPGVGKTTLVREFARRMKKGEISFLTGWRFARIDCRCISPDDTRGCLQALSEATDGMSSLILCLDGLGALLKRTGGGNNASLFQPFLRRKDLKLIGVLSGWEHSELIASDSGMREPFTRIEIEEPDESITTEIVHQVADRLVGQFELEIPESIVERTVSLTSHFVLNEQQPAKSISILRRICEDADYERTQLGRDRKVITEEDVCTAISEKTGLSVDAVAGQDGPVDYLSALEAAVVGQEDAVRTVAQELRLIKAGINDPGKPAAVMLFAGMTGVGKTELAKRVAELYSTSKRLNTYAMGNFTEAHSVSGIIGVPPGYVGHEEGGRLVNELKADPYAVFLLDEAEKAHPNVWKPFLNLFDEGWIIDQRGVKAHAERAIFILTTNAGDRAITQMTRSGKSHEEISQHVKSALSRIRQERSSQPVFPPQFLARIQHLVVFTALGEAAMVGIAQRVVSQLQKRWKQKRRKRIEVSNDVIELIGRRAFEVNEKASGREGGRLVRKFVTELIEVPIQEAGLVDPHGYRESPVIRVFNSGEANAPTEVHVAFGGPYCGENLPGRQTMPDDR